MSSQPGSRGTSRGRGRSRGRGQSLVAASPALPIAKAIGVNRPGYGTGSRGIRVLVNVVPVDVPDGIIHHYDVITPSKQPKFAFQLVTQLQGENLGIFTPRAVFDGNKNLFAVRRLPLADGDSQTFHLLIPTVNQQSNRPPPSVEIKLTKVAEINLNILHEFMHGRRSWSNEIQTCMTALNVVIRMGPMMKHAYDRRAFYTSRDFLPISRGLQLWRGYFQSLKVGANRMYLNIDISTAMFYPAGELISLCLSFFNRGNNVNMLSPSHGLPEQQRQELARFLSGVRIMGDGPSGPRNYTIRGLSSRGANQETFDMQGQGSMTVANYYLTHGAQPITLRFPQLLCIKTARNAMIPLEKCTVIPGQVARQQIPDEDRDKLVKFATMLPAARIKAIKDGMPMLCHGQSEYVRSFGLNIDPTQLPHELNARVIDPPKLEFGGTSADRHTNPQRGAWNLANKKLFKPNKIGAWVLAILDVRYFRQDHEENMVRGLIAECQKLGVDLQHQTPIKRVVNPQHDIEKSLREAGGECKTRFNVLPNLIVAVLPTAGNRDLYLRIKRFGHELGVATQCLLASKCQNAKSQYWANVLLKINLKLGADTGGINWILSGPSNPAGDPRNPTIIMGADVIHPPPGSYNAIAPSFASVVSSIGSKAFYYVSVDDIQRGRTEIIENMDKMTKDLLVLYKGYHDRYEKGAPKPQRIIFYRDGVSEGELQQVLDNEIPLIKKACRDLDMDMKLTFIVVNKRHHIRLVKNNERPRPGEDPIINCEAGTVVDRDITHPIEFDFYLQSHAAILGTSRCTHYTVLYDECKMSADGIQQVSYNLCHNFARATRSVSYPAPVYYADRACDHAKMRFNPQEFTHADLEGKSVDEILSEFKRYWRPLKGGLGRTMHFM